MTEQRDLDRLLGAYFVDGTDEVADRVIEAALVQINHTKQRRRFRLPRRFPTMTMPNRIAAAAVIGVLAVGGAYYLSRPAQPAVGGPSPAPTTQLPATSSPAGGGSGSAHYEITGPDAASGDARFASSSRDPSSDSFSQSVRFEDGPLVIRIRLQPPGTPSSVHPVGTVDISTATATLHDAGPSCTWDTASLTANGGTGTVDCVDAVNPAHPTTPNRVSITFTYQDPSASKS
jgi:hypothetical protein